MAREMMMKRYRVRYELVPLSGRTDWKTTCETDDLNEALEAFDQFRLYMKGHVVLMDGTKTIKDAGKTGLYEWSCRRGHGVFNVKTKHPAADAFIYRAPQCPMCKLPMTPGASGQTRHQQRQRTVQTNRAELLKQQQEKERQFKAAKAEKQDAPLPEPTPQKPKKPVGFKRIIVKDE